MQTIDIDYSLSASGNFLDENFVLDSETARYLYFEFVQNLPIVDYHNHLPPDEVATDKRYADMTDLWLKGDHYKWRAMRANGIPERLITGDAGNAEKFQAWAQTVPYTMRNPLYHWTHMELKRPFGISQLLNETSSRAIYEQCNEQLRHQWSARSLLQYHNVKVVCTTDEPTDDLRYHQQFAAERAANGEEGLTMLPTFRPDALFPVAGTAWRERIEQLSISSGLAITDLDSFVQALARRVQFFHETGCRAADHGLAQMPPVVDRTTELDKAFNRLLTGQMEADPIQLEQLTGYVLLELCRMYHQRGWVQQFHLGALRQVNTRITRQLGINVGVDSMGDLPQANRLASFLDALDKTDKLARTVLYNLNPADNDVFATMVGNFQDGSVAGKMQWGSAWWFLDQKDGMENQLNILSNMGLLSRFIGMVTDSRSFLSFSRHEYFRRILCRLIGRDVENGLLPKDLNWLGQLAANIAYHNVTKYFDWEN
ncbi:glucuronate isomerase [Fibrisoma montanum]|uniref:Uronate isomerase n=1 Tax=Fibrisoma montanum TaxID=2305895 RepID=A0A418MEE1_9BACT|nr:glucuronate isomerase [Fibrisoma montanum]RIV25146.1 glucuronate isomerase [Fibrisoma montanum]